MLALFKLLPEEERRPALPDPGEAQPAKRPVPEPPANGMILRGYCTYLQETTDGEVARKKQMYYEENPDAWAAETQNDMLWLTEDEWRSLVPTELKEGSSVEVPHSIRERFFSTIGIDYMEGSVNALPTRESKMTITVEKVRGPIVKMSLAGSGQMGVPFPEHDKDAERSRGCMLRVRGKLEFNREKEEFSQFQMVGLGKAWGNKMNYTKRAIRIAEYPWLYGVACELVTTRKPVDLIPPYNLVHYGSGIPYFEER